MMRVVTRCLVPVLLLMAFTDGSGAQTWVYSSVTGQQGFTANLRPDAVLLLSGPADQTLTSWQALPFPWDFYGSPVTGYAASDNGYITFDPAATVSVAENRGTADPGGPNNAIYAFWDDVHLGGGMPTWSNEIRSITIGTAPQRIHVVMWVGVAPAGQQPSSSNSLSFAIALLEQGGFAIVQVAGRRTVRMSGSMGCENADGSMATFVDGSPALEFPLLGPSADDDITWYFTWSDEKLDLALLAADLPAELVAGSARSIDCTVKNTGHDLIDSFELELSVDGVVIGSTPVTGAALDQNSSRVVTVSPWTPGAAGRFADVRLRIVSVNGGPDDRAANDTLHLAPWIVLGRGTARRPLVEEFTGAWCGWCPDGAVQMQAVEAAFPDAVLVSIHAGGTDAMISREGAEIAATYTPVYPSAMVDRMRFPGQAAVPLGRSQNAWLLRTGERRLTTSPVAIAVASNVDTMTRALDVSVTVRFIDHVLPGDLRLHVFVVEDRVVGFGSGYDQVNYYSRNTSYPTHPYFSEANPVVGFVHRHVLREALTGYPGDDAVLPDAPRADSVVSARYSWIVPAGMQLHEMKIVAFVSRHGASLDERAVLNAEAVPLVNGVTRVASAPAPSSLELALHPNPAHGTLHAVIRSGDAGGTVLTFRDLLGRSVHRTFVPGGGHGTAVIDVSAWPAGSYLCIAEHAGTVSSRLLRIVR